MSRKRLFFASIVVLILGGLLLSPVQGATLNSNWASTTPTIDGAISAGEWNDAAAVSFYAYNDVSKNYLQVFLWAKNNNSYLFLRLQWLDSTHDANYDQMVIYFDEANDGSWAGPAIENAVALVMNSTIHLWYDAYTDTGAYYGSLPDVGPKDGLGAITYNTLAYVVELAIPIGSADLEDLQPVAGCTIGIAFLVQDHSNYYEYPAGTWTNYSVVTLQLNTAPSGIGILILPIFILAFTFLIVLDIMKKGYPDFLK